MAPEPPAGLQNALRRLLEHTRPAAPDGIPRADREKALPLSYAQQRLWLVDRLAPGAAYNVPLTLRMRGPLDPDRLGSALTAVAERHEVLRTVILDEDGRAAQRIQPPCAVPVVTVRASGEAAAARLVADEIARPFDLARGPLIRALVVRLADDDQVLALTMHHVVTDAWSQAILWSELSTAYAALSAGSEPSWAPLPVQYADFAAWQRQWLTGPVLDRQWAYWQRQLAGLPAALELPTDRPREAVMGYEAGSRAWEISPAAARAVRLLGERENATPFMVLLALFQLVLGRYAGTADVAVGSPVANRPRAELEGLIGFFVNTVVLRTDLSGDPSFRALVGRVRETALGAFAHQDLPFEHLVERLAPERDLSRNPLVQVVFQLAGSLPDFAAWPGATASIFPAGREFTRMDLEVYLFPAADGGLYGRVVHSRALFDDATVERLVEHLGRALDQVLADPDRPISAVDPLGAEERDDLLRARNDTARPLPEASLPDLFDRVVTRTPHAVALELPGGKRMTYAELAARAYRLAHRLRAAGVSAEEPVGLHLDRGAGMIVAILGVLAAGGAYLPLDRRDPRARTEQILAGSGARLVLSDRPDAFSGAVVLPVEAPGDPATRPAVRPRPDAAAYVMSTSGSTGVPKGVVVTHRNVVALALDERWRNGNHDRVLLHSPYVFDASTYEIWAPLLAGGCVVVAPPGELGLHELGRAIVAGRVGGLWLTAGLFAALVAENPGCFREGQVREVWTGGEAVPPEAVTTLLAVNPAITVVDGYGPTETTTFATSYAMTADRPPRGRVPIGRPLDNSRVYVLDDRLRPVPAGVAGELFIGGAGVARGYHRRPGLTAERFLADPYGEPGSRMYRTGDRARWSAGGVLEYLGRDDDQVKIRGLRIEPGEAAAVLERQEPVAAAAVVVREDRPGDKRLVAYVVPAVPGDDPSGRLRAALEARLPGYLVPTDFVLLDALPRTANGKLDRRALPAPGRPAAEDGTAAPATERERLVCAVFAEVLDRPAVGPGDGFFALGGHSLLAAQAAARLQARLGVEVPLRLLFRHPTARALATALPGDRPDPGRIAPARRDRPLPLSSGQRRLWFVDQLAPGGSAYNVPFAVRVRGPVDAGTLAAALSTVVERHESLRTVFREAGGEPVQVILPPAPLVVPVVEAADEAEARRLVGDDAERGFDLAAGPLVRALLVRLAADDHVVAVTMHHAVTDAWSQGVLGTELPAAYTALAAGSKPVLKPLAVQYADFAVWQRERLSAERVAELAGYWQDQLRGLRPLELPADRPRPPVASPAAGWCDFRLPADVVAAARALAERENATPFMVLLALFQLVLGRTAGTDDVAVGSPVANRPRPELEDLIGFFVNTVVLRTDLSGDPSFRALVGRVRETALGAFAHQELPFEHLVERLAPERDLSRHPLVQVVFQVVNTPSFGRLDDAAGPAEVFAPDRMSTRVDLELHLVEQQDGSMAGRAVFSAALFDEPTVARLAGRLAAAAREVLTEPDRPIGSSWLLEPAERDAVLRGWQGPRQEIPAATLTELFAEQARIKPDAVAAVQDGRAVTYAELDRDSNRLAHRLLALGLAAEGVVGLDLGRSPDVVTAVLAVLKAGGAYLPLDARNPAARRLTMLTEAGARLVLTDCPERTAEAVRGTGIVVVDVRADLTGHPGTPPQPRARPDSLAYVIYTSGSTGRPKGVGVTHRNVAGFALDELFTGGRYERVLVHSSYAFDVSTAEMWPALLGGGTLVFAPPGDLDAATYHDVVRRHEVTALFLTPGLLDLLAEECPDAFASVREVQAGGDKVSAATVSGLLDRHPGLEVVDVYGPTEATVIATGFRMNARSRPAAGAVPIGRPLANRRVLVLDRQLRPVPVGVPGDLYVSGIGLSRGYLNRPGLTAELFRPDPYGPPGARMYRTGDLGRWRPDGTLEYLGRVDEQVKIRGFRVEPGEVEAVLRRHERVAQALVVARDDGPAGLRLIGYIVPGAPVGEEELRAHAVAALPDYMVPSAFVVLPALPLTSTGKVDRRALPDPGPADRPGLVAPRTPQEELLCGIFAEVLGAAEVGIDDGFFALGGHSLLATRVVSRIRAATGLAVSLEALFRNPTPRTLAEALPQGRPGSGEAGAVRPAGRDRPLPLSSGQRRLWFLDRLAPGTTSWNATSAIRLRGPLDVGALRAAVSAVVARHEVLRTVFDASGGEPVQIVLPAAPVPVELATGDPAAAVAALAARGFDLTTGPLLRVLVVELGRDDHVVAFGMHHVVTDAWSQGVLWRDLVRAYEAALAGAAPGLAPLPIQYADFAVWQRERMSGPEHEREWAYWRRRLDGCSFVLDLPADRARPAVATHDAGTLEWVIPAEVASAVRALAERENATVFMVLLAVFQLVLGRHAGTGDVAVGSPVANRPRPELEDLIGFFVNTVVLRTDLSGDPSFRALVGQVRETALGAFAHQSLPFEHLVERLAPERDLSRHPLVQAVFQVVNTPFERLPWPGADVEVFESGTAGTRLDLELHLVERADGTISGPLVYNSSLFGPATAARLVGHLGTALAAAVAEPELPLSRIPLSDRSERAALLALGTGAAAGIPATSLPDLLMEQARRTPELTAVEYEGDTLTYAQLLSRANGLAHRLRAAGAGPDRLVGLCLPRGLDMIVGLVGILQAGAAYVPVNAEHPAERVRYVIANARMDVVVTEPGARGLFDGQVRTVVELDDAVAATPPDTGVTIDHLAYVVYTSGSTGTPKGIAMPGRCVVNMLEWQKRAVPGGPGTRTAQFTELTFDVHVQEVLSALLYGETLVVPPAAIRRDPVAFVGWLSRTAVNQMFVPNVMIRAVAAAARRTGADLSALRHISQAGEALSLDDDLRALAGRRPRPRIHNHYGSTEVQVVTAYTAPEDPAQWPGAAPVGEPTWNHSIYVVDELMRLVPAGVAGEICVAGPGLARGYVDRPGLTAERFVADPYGAPGARMYRTGDVGRWRADGLLEYLGRADDQVKIRGFRVEPGEVETVLRRHDAVAAAAVVARPDGAGGRRLVAYVVPVAGADTGSLRAHVAAAVPEYMVPSAFVTVAEFPLTSTGKIDRRALPDPGVRGEVAAGYVAPRTAEETVVCAVFAELFGGGRIGVDDDFFALGGHSLLATQVVTRLESATGVPLPLADVFRLRTPRAVAAALAEAPRAAAVGIEPAGRERPLPLSYAQEGYLLLERRQPGSPLWNVPFMMLAAGPLDLGALGHAVTLLLSRHEALRTTVTGTAQHIGKVTPVTLVAEPVPGRTPEERERAARDLAAEEAARPFDLARGPILRARVLRLAPDRHVIMLTTHHIATDAWSQEVLWGELATAYAARLEGREPGLSPLPVQYADFAVWQRRALDVERLWSYWSRALSGRAPFALPPDRARTGPDDPAGDSVVWPIDADLVRAATRWGAEQDTTLFTTLLAAFQLTLAAAAGNDDVVVASPVAGRTRTEIEPLIGGFANMLLLRTRVGGDPTGRELLDRAAATATGAYAHQDMPYHLLAERLGDDQPARVMFQLINTSPARVSLAGARLEPFDYRRVTVRMELEVTLMSHDGELTAHALYRTSLFDRTTVERLLSDFTAVLGALAADPGRPVSTVLPTAAEARR
ncbi:hypothetical protein Ade02nite_93060 [Paractinoplanes deccanensis]|uniref:Carrier domain-containing protein n=1 Tax=Paractinoplanes deccanensis TaxID=113561 RepID=A0ABQ3YL55_9ACTN|nr:non-ribosomal peptide synthetase [Actinoplanes deccanensis]GID80665.1 hypothetical protein Ade02nite_93060 [Actinoplanes deccanensis]